MTARGLLRRLARGAMTRAEIASLCGAENGDGRKLVAELLAAGLVRQEAGTIHLSEEGRMHLRRMLSGGDDSFRGQHQERASQPVPHNARPEHEDKAGHVLVDLGESPLAWLASRRDAKGQALLNPGQVEAGERLRQDFTFAGMMPQLAGGWRTERISGGAGAGAGIDLNDQVIAARQRVETALAAVGPGLSPVLVDVCCLLKGLETVERERGWPARSAKVVLGLGLSCLDEHYRLGRGRVRPPGPSPRRSGSVRPST
ncbi:MAG: DUF6456 domain-containing protein [Pannonibacter sp.]